jgi:hypothetical protein
MRRWDRLQDAYMEEYRARGLSEQTVLCTESRLDRWGRWLKKRRPASRDRTHRCGDDHTLYRGVCQLSFEGYNLRHAEHDARIRRLSGAPGREDVDGG